MSSTTNTAFIPRVATLLAFATAAAILPLPLPLFAEPQPPTQVDALLTNWTKRFSSVPNTRFSFSFTSKGKTRFFEFCHSKGRFYSKEFESKEHKAIKNMAAFDGSTFYVLYPGKHLAVSGSHLPLKDMLASHFIVNPFFNPYSMLHLHDTSNFTLPSLQSPDAWRATLSKATIEVHQDDSISLSTTDQSLNAAVTPDLPFPGRINGRVGPWEADWKVVKTASFAEEGSLKCIPWTIVCNYTENGQMVADSYTIELDVTSLELMQENLPDEWFHIPWSAAESLFDWDRGTAIDNRSCRIAK